MSSSNNQKVKRNTASPSTRHGPLRATQQFVLVDVGGTPISSPSRKHPVRKTPVSSPTPKSSKSAKARSHSETGFISNRRSPTSPLCKVEKPKAIRAAGSLDSINLYLSGQWPKDGSNKQKSSREGLHIPYSLTNTGLSTHISTPHNGAFNPPTSLNTDAVFKKDKCTQTEDIEDIDLRLWQSSQVVPTKFAVGFKRSKSAGNSDGWSLKSREIKARLQRKDNTSARGCQTLQRFSPVPFPINSSILTPLATTSSQPIKIPVQILENGVLRGTPGKARASVEGLNPEIEKLIISATSAVHTGEEEYQNGAQPPLCVFDYLDGRRAPVPDALNHTRREMLTQTPSQVELVHPLGYHSPGAPSDSLYNSRSCSRASTTDTEGGSRPASVSPSPFLLGPLDIEEHANESGDTRRSAVSDAMSPHPYSSAQFRLPPDGAEKLKLFNEIGDYRTGGVSSSNHKSVPIMKHFLTADMVSTVKLQASERSAFSSLSKGSSSAAFTSGARRSPISLRHTEELR